MGRLLKKRLIPKILINRVDNVWQAGITSRFENFKAVANPVSLARIYQAQSADELFICNMNQGNDSLESCLGILEQISNELLLPVTYSGQIRSLHQMDKLFATGADKIALNTLFFDEQAIARDAINLYGSANVSLCLDYRASFGVCFKSGGQLNTGKSLKLAVSECIQAGFGELFLQDIERDGQMIGFDDSLASWVKDQRIPIILASGCGKVSHLIDALSEEQIDGVAAGSFFARQDQNIHQVRSKIMVSGIAIRQGE